MIPMLLLISFIVYFGLQLTGIDPINFMVSPEMLSSNKENVEALRQSLGLNDPMIVQYFRWLGNCLHGDFGYSLKEGSSISSIIAVRLPYTFELAGYSLIFSAIRFQSIIFVRSFLFYGCCDGSLLPEGS